MGRKIVLLALVVITAGMIPLAVGASDDEWPDDCDDAEVSSQSGDYKGSIDSPDDHDMIKFRLDKGEYISVSILLPEEEGDATLRLRGADTADVGTFKDRSNVESSSAGVSPTSGPVNASARYYAEESGIHCFGINDNSDNAEIPYEWRLKLRHNDPEPATFEVTQLQERVAELESQLNQKDQRISALESRLTEKNQTIEELRARISELESQTPSGEGENSGDNDVSISVTVTPANNQENFVAGGKAIVQAQSDTADVSQMTIEYGSGTYQLNSSGEVAIPLADTGEQQMRLSYGETTEQVTITVEEATSSGQQDQQEQDQQDDGQSSGDGSGFTIVLALVAVIGGGALIARQR